MESLNNTLTEPESGCLILPSQNGLTPGYVFARCAPRYFRIGPLVKDGQRDLAPLRAANYPRRRLRVAKRKQEVSEMEETPPAIKSGSAPPKGFQWSQRGLETDPRSQC